MCPRYQLRLGGVIVQRGNRAPAEIPWRWLCGNRSGTWWLRPEIRALHPELPRSIFLPSGLPRAAWRLHVRQARQDLRRGALRRSLVLKSDAAQAWSIAALSLALIVLLALLPRNTWRGDWRELIDFSHDWLLSIAILAMAAIVIVPCVLLAAWAVHRALVEHRAARAPNAAIAVHFEATGLTVECCDGTRQQFA